MIFEYLPIRQAREPRSDRQQRQPGFGSLKIDQLVSIRIEKSELKISPNSNYYCATFQGFFLKILTLATLSEKPKR